MERRRVVTFVRPCYVRPMGLALEGWEWHTHFTEGILRGSPTFLLKQGLT